MLETSFAPGPDTTRAFRDALGCFGTGVTVVTTRGPDGPLAMTVNSFSSVSLDPPLVLWCAARDSSRHDPFARAAAFAIHVLGEDQQDMAMRFARLGTDFEGVDWTEGADGVPLLNQCLARFECRQSAVHDGGDHSILIGRVLVASHRPGPGLMFKRGKFGAFAGSG